MLFLTVGLFRVYSQGKIADSLYRVLTVRNLSDTARVKTLIELANYYCEVNADTSLLFGKKAKELIEHKQLNHFLPRALRFIAIAHVIKGEYSISRSYLRQAIRGCNYDSTLFLKKERALAYNLQGVILDNEGKSDSALFYYFKSLETFKKLNDVVGIVNRLNNIATVYQDLGNHSLALRYYFEAFQLLPSARVAQNVGHIYSLMDEPAKAKKFLLIALVLYDKESEFDDTGVAVVNEHLANLYSSSGKSDSAMYYLTRALRINERARYKTGIARDHYFFGRHYKNVGQWMEAAKEAETSIDIHRQIGEKMGIAVSTALLAEAMFMLGKVDEALVTAHQGHRLAKEIKAKEVQKGYLELLAKIYSAKRDFEHAYFFSHDLNVLKDSINNEEEIKQVANMEALYENDKKEKELEVVRARNLVADAQLSQEETKATLLIVGLSLATLVLVVGSFSYLALRKNRRALEYKNEELRKLNQTKDRFFAIVGHDLRGPITSFSGINDLLNWHISKNDMEKVKAMGLKISQSVRQLDTLLNNLLNWAMSQTDAVPYRPEPIQLNKITTECYLFFEHALELKQISLENQTKDDCFVYADKNALATVLRNLISNAIKFTPIAGRITISSRLIHNFVWIDVRDTGVGLPPEKFSTIFALSENKTTSGTSGEKGTGLGLVLCSDYVALNKGTIEAQSEVGKGTVFSFSVPSFQPREQQRLKKEMSHG